MNLHAGVLSNFNTVLLQFYAQTYSNLRQIYHCNNYITSLSHLTHLTHLSQHQNQAIKFVQRAEEKLAL